MNDSISPFCHQDTVRLADLRNGDLIGWRRIEPKRTSEMYLNLVRAATFSDFGHVSIVWNRPESIAHVEAVAPLIRRVNIPITGEAYVVRTGMDIPDQVMAEFFNDKIGLKYSFRDAIMGYLGVTPPEEDRWQCAELSLEFLRSVGYSLPDAYTPSRLIRKALIHTGKPMYYVQH